MDSLNSLVGVFLSDAYFTYATVVTALAFVCTAYFGLPFFVWSALGLIALVGFGAPWALTGAFAAVCALFLIRPLRAATVSRAVMKTMQALQLMPKISATERTALEAGVVWMEKELFSGHPDFKKMLAQPYHELADHERRFLDTEVEQLCAMVDDYKFIRTRELPQEAFDFIRRKGFLGMMIPKEWGGLGFSYSAQSAVLQKIASRSVGTTILVMVPNSLGPAELLLHYGTEPQKQKYLKRLAVGDEIPCFGLTEPTAGSDAGSITADGVIFKGEDGKLQIRLNWKKRWITLAGISTLIGLAFRLRDPENLLGLGEDVGITCALIPSSVKGVVIGNRHDPLGVPFQNCPTEGHDVVVNAEDAIVGGVAGAGKGWGMLMECLGAGRGVSLPAQAAGGTKLAARVVGNHSLIRKQFGVSIGKFEGVEEPIARISGIAYFVEALRKYVLSALDQKIFPGVVTALAKYNATELGRVAINDAMDVMGGAGISMGPRNLLAGTYIATPIGITVEGANIMTRTLIIFGQGALRAHPYAFKEVDAIENNDLRAFDGAFWGHVGHIVRNLVRSVVLSFTRARLVWSPVGGSSRRYVQKLAWISASFAIMTDLSMGMLGGKLKIKEKLTGRFADILSYMFIATAILKRFEAEGRKPEDKAMLDYSMAFCFQKIQDGFDGIFGNMDVPGLYWFFKGPVRWWSRLNFVGLAPTDRLTHKVANALLVNEGVRDRLTAGIYMPTQPNEALARLEHAYKTIRAAEAVDKKIRAAVVAKKLKKKSKTLLDDALKAGVITASEQTLLAEAERLRWDAIQVDEFTPEEYLSGLVKADLEHHNVRPLRATSH